MSSNGIFEFSIHSHFLQFSVFSVLLSLHLTVLSFYFHLVLSSDSRAAFEKQMEKRRLMKNITDSCEAFPRETKLLSFNLLFHVYIPEDPALSLYVLPILVQQVVLKVCSPADATVE